MKKIIGEVILNGRMLNIASEDLKSYNSVDFITALVSLCSTLSIDIPIWTLVEERELMKYREVKFDLGNERYLRISI
jgi:hypothetical protein